MENSELEALKEQLASCKRLTRDHKRNSLWYKDDAGFHIECFGDIDSNSPEIITAHKFPQVTFKNHKEELEFLNGLYTFTREELNYVHREGKWEHWGMREAMFYASLFGSQSHHRGYVLNQGCIESKLIPEDLKVRIFAVDYYNNLRRKRK